jgi:hypothetical protein
MFATKSRAAFFTALLLTLYACACGAADSPSKQQQEQKPQRSTLSAPTSAKGGGGVDLWADLLMACVVIFVVLAPAFCFRVPSAPSSRHAASHKSKQQ